MTFKPLHRVLLKKSVLVTSRDVLVSGNARTASEHSTLIFFFSLGTGPCNENFCQGCFWIQFCFLSFRKKDLYSPFQKNWALTTTTCRLIRAQTVARPWYGVRVLIKEEDDDVWRQNYRPVMVLGVVPSRCRLNTAVCGRSKYFFLVTEHFQASWLLFFRVG